MHFAHGSHYAHNSQIAQVISHNSLKTQLNRRVQIAIVRQIMHNKRMTVHEDWYYNTVNGDTEKAASLRAGITTSTLNRQLAKGTLSEGNVIAIARAYGQNPVEALVRTGYLTKEEATNSSQSLIKMLNDQELIHELALRVNSDEAIWAETFGKAMSLDNDPQTDAKQGTTFTEHKHSQVIPDDPWAAAAAVSGKDSWRGDEMVADDSEEEGFLGDDNYSDGP